MAYKHDIFISYTHNHIKEWVNQHFYPLFAIYLEGSLGRKPDIFIDNQGILTGDSWPLRLKEALAYSRCVVAIWSPSYFTSEWCQRECYIMLQREKLLGYRTLQNPGGLLLPVNVSDGRGFPDYAKTIQYFDCRDFLLFGQGFEKTEIYIKFQQRIREWTEEVATAIENAPQWSSEWLNDNIIEIPEVSIPTFELPTLS